MNRVFHIICLASFWAAGTLSAEAHPNQKNSALAAAFGACGEPCVIRFSPGGEVRTFQAAALAVRAGSKRLVVIDGPCISACAIFADLARTRVCITDRATFGFHKAQRIGVRRLGNGTIRKLDLGRYDPPHSSDIAHWVRRNGGYPVEGLRMMGTKQAAQFWRRCRTTST
jgi:hypothetical protein